VKTVRKTTAMAEDLFKGTRAFQYPATLHEDRSIFLRFRNDLYSSESNSEK
jgi:hypothetical protein